MTMRELEPDDQPLDAQTAFQKVVSSATKGSVLPLELVALRDALIHDTTRSLEGDHLLDALQQLDGELKAHYVLGPKPTVCPSCRRPF